MVATYMLVLGLSFCNGIWCSGEVKEYSYADETLCKVAGESFQEFYGDALKKWSCIPAGIEPQGEQG